MNNFSTWIDFSVYLILNSNIFMIINNWVKLIIKVFINKKILYIYYFNMPSSSHVPFISLFLSGLSGYNNWIKFKATPSQNKTIPVE